MVEPKEGQVWLDGADNRKLVLSYDGHFVEWKYQWVHGPLGKRKSRCRIASWNRWAKHATLVEDGK